MGPKSPTLLNQISQIACEVTKMQGIVRSRGFTTSRTDSEASTQRSQARWEILGVLFLGKGKQEVLEKWAHQDSNLGPTGYEPAALAAEPWALSNYSPSTKERNLLDRDGWRNLRSAFASICLILSLVTSKS